MRAVAQFLDWLGSQLISFATRNFGLTFLAGRVLLLGISPASWRYPSRDRLARQILFSGVEAVPIVVLIGIVIGGASILQIRMWADLTGDVTELSAFLTVMVIREVAPLLSLAVIIAASVSAMTSEIATMKSSREISLLQGLGIPPLTYLALPRCVGLAISAFGLAVILSATAIASGLFGSALFYSHLYPLGSLATEMANRLGGIDFLNLLVRTLIPGFLCALICYQEGAKAENSSSSVPKAVTAAMLRSIVLLVLVSAAMVVVTYLWS